MSYIIVLCSVILVFNSTLSTINIAPPSCLLVCLVLRLPDVMYLPSEASPFMSLGYSFFFFLIFIYFIYFFYGCVGSSFLCEGFLQLWQVGATLHRGARASHHRGLSCCGAQAPDVQAQ